MLLSNKFSRVQIMVNFHMVNKSRKPLTLTNMVNVAAFVRSVC